MSKPFMMFLLIRGHKLPTSETDVCRQLHFWSLHISDELFVFW